MRLLLRFRSREFPRFLQRNDASPVSLARTETLRPINQRGGGEGGGEGGTKYKLFFLARTTFHLRRPATVSRDLSPAKRRCANRRATRAETTSLQATTSYPVIPHSSTYATPRAR